MITHDILAYAVAAEAVRQIRAQEPQWGGMFSANVFATTSRRWPVPDFVIVDSDSLDGNKKPITIAGEFKPPDQTKREYLTGLRESPPPIQRAPHVFRHVGASDGARQGRSSSARGACLDTPRRRDRPRQGVGFSTQGRPTARHPRVRGLWTPDGSPRRPGPAQRMGLTVPSRAILGPRPTPPPAQT